MRALAFTADDLPGGALDGVQVERARPRWRVSNTPLGPGFRRRVARLLRAWRPDVLVAHTPVPFPAEMAAAAARREGVPLVVTYHAGRLEGGRPGLDALAALDRATLERRMLAGAAQLVAVSPFVRDAALDRYRSKVAVIPPGVEHGRFRPGPHRGERAVLFVGPLREAYRWKGLDVLWDAFRLLRDRTPGAQLWLVGEGERVGELKARAARDGLGGAVRFLGRLPEDALVRAYQRCRLAALPSTSSAEAFGMVLAEANACGRPAVGSRIGGIPGFVRPGDNGLLAEPGDARDLAEQLAVLLDDAALAERLGRRGRARVVAEHDWDRLAERTERLLAEAAEARAPHARACPR